MLWIYFCVTLLKAVNCTCKMTVNSLNFFLKHTQTWYVWGCFIFVFLSQHGEVECRPVECPELPCKHPVNITGECCQSCLRKRSTMNFKPQNNFCFNRTLLLQWSLLRSRRASYYQEMHRLWVSWWKHAVCQDRSGDYVSCPYLSTRRTIQCGRQLLQILQRLVYLS